MTEKRNASKLGKALVKEIWRAKDPDIGKVRLLLDAGADVNYLHLNYIRNAPLVAAVDRDRLDIARLLLERGAKPAGNNGDLHLPGLAARHGNFNMFKLLAEAGVDHGSRPLDTLVRLAGQFPEKIAGIRPMIKYTVDAGMTEELIKPPAYGLEANSVMFDVRRLKDPETVALLEEAYVAEKRKNLASRISALQGQIKDLAKELAALPGEAQPGAAGPAGNTAAPRQEPALKL